MDCYSLSLFPPYCLAALSIKPTRLHRKRQPQSNLRQRRQCPRQRNHPSRCRRRCNYAKKFVHLRNSALAVTCGMSKANLPWLWYFRMPKPCGNCGRARQNMSPPHFVLLRSLPTEKRLFFFGLKTQNRLVATPVKRRSGVSGLFMEAMETIDIKSHTAPRRKRQTRGRVSCIGCKSGKRWLLA